MPPQARFDEFCDVSPAKSPRSISATFAPREESAAAQTAPLIPPPSTSTSNCSLASLLRLVSRSVGAGWLMRAKIHRLRYGSAVLGSPIAPMLAKLADGLPEGEGWIYEPKWDGFRALVFRDGAELLLQSRDLKPLNRYFPELEPPLLQQLPKRCVLDGE